MSTVAAPAVSNAFAGTAAVAETANVPSPRSTNAFSATRSCTPAPSSRSTSSRTTTGGNEGSELVPKRSGVRHVGRAVDGYFEGSAGFPNLAQCHRLRMNGVAEPVFRGGARIALRPFVDRAGCLSPRAIDGTSTASAGLKAHSLDIPRRNLRRADGECRTAPFMFRLAGRSSPPGCMAPCSGKNWRMRE